MDKKGILVLKSGWDLFSFPPVHNVVEKREGGLHKIYSLTLDKIG